MGRTRLGEHERDQDVSHLTAAGAAPANALRRGAGKFFPAARPARARLSIWRGNTPAARTGRLASGYRVSSRLDPPAAPGAEPRSPAGRPLRHQPPDTAP